MTTNLTAVRKILFVGMNNPRGDEPLWPRPYNTAGHRLYRLINQAVGWEMDDYIGQTDRVNFCETGQLDMDRARKRLGAIREITQGRRTVAVGVAAATLLGAPHGDGEWFQWDGNLAAIPHTSPMNFWWNDKSNWARTVQFLKETLT